MTDRIQRVRDPVHGLITFRPTERVDQLAWALLDTPEFQRLRRIKQLGVSEFIFPSATHTRFAHSIGVFHTARQLVEIIRRETENFNSDRAEVATIAALLHDLGHGPFSHTFESVQKSRGVAKRHELWTAEIVRSGPKISQLLRSYREDKRFGEEVAAMLEAEDPIDIYHAVVSSSFDADRLDYLRRDRLMTGTGAGAIDFDWLLEHIKIQDIAVEAADDDDPEEAIRVPTFCLESKARPAAEQFLLARYTLHEQVYLHKTTRCIEHMIGLLLQRISELARMGEHAFQQSGLPQNHAIWRFFRSDTPTLSEYLALDDVVVMGAFDLMLSASDPQVADLASRLRHRNLFKTLDLRDFGMDEGRQNSRARRIDRAISEKKTFEGRIWKDENAKIGIYTQIGGDDERTHKKLHILDATGPREITEFSPMIRALPAKQQFTRYYFENESDRLLAKQLRRAQ